MIPVRVHVRDFLCYENGRDGRPLTFDFEGSRLWSISGDNGAGKSAIFDAIRYALYGEHRDGSQRDARLIRRGAASCDVEFEFRSDGKLYRVRRTVGRARGKSLIEPKTWQAALYDDAEQVWVPIPGTDRKDGLDSWVRERLRLNYGTFIASVLLLQGESDKLTRAGSKERFEILSGLLALEAYERLANAAKEAARLHRSQADQLEARLVEQPEVNAEDLDAARVAADKAEHELAIAQTDVVGAGALVAGAEAYEDLTKELNRLGTSLSQTEALLTDGPRIKEEYAEWSSLSEHLPRMRQALVAVRDAREKEREAAAASAALGGINLTDLQEAIDDAEHTGEVASAAFDQAGDQLEAHSAALETLRATLGILEQHDATSVRVAQLTESLEPLRTQLKGLPALEVTCAEGRTLREALPRIILIRATAKRVMDREGDLSTLREQLKALPALEAACAEERTLREALPQIKLIRAATTRVGDLTRSLSASRAQLSGIGEVTKACADGRTCREALPVVRLIRDRQLVAAARRRELEKVGAVVSWQSKIKALEKALASANAQSETAERQRAEAARELARADEQQESARSELRARAEAKDEAVCSRCGQKVSPEHIKLELSQAKARVADASSRLRTANAASEVASEGLALVAGELKSVEADLAAAKAKAAEAQACAKELAASEGDLAAAKAEAANASSAVQAVVRDATQEEPIVALKTIERRVQGLPKIEQQYEALREVEADARAIEAQLARERAVLENLVAMRGDAQNLSGGARQVVRGVTQEDPSVTLETIEQTVLALPKREREIEGMRKVEGKARAAEAQLATERAALQKLLAELDDGAKTPVEVGRVVRDATLEPPTVPVEIVEAKVRVLPTSERQLETLRNVEGNARAVEAQLAQECATLKGLETQVPPDEGQRVREEAARLEKEREDARIRRGRAQESVRSAQKQAKEAREKLATAQARRGELEATARECSLGATRLREQAQMRLEAVTPPERDAVLRGDETAVTGAEARLRALGHAQSAYESLAQASERRVALASRIEGISEQVIKTPLEHRLSVIAALEKQATAARRLTTAQARRDDTREGLRTLLTRSSLRLELETQRGSERRSSQLYGRLAELFGRGGLQAVLMDEATAGIGQLANETLNRISGGQLRLVMERETGARGEEIKIHAIDLGSSDDPLDVAFLSGSQKFRVAVALAAGIGQYSAGADRIRALIIDEGFGSLDEQGRQQMVDELRSLSGVLDRVIVISHQEDFRDRTLFPTGYVLHKTHQKTEILRFV